jgi:hypothetical protein
MFDFTSEADLFPDHTSRPKHLRFRRFVHAAEAVRFAIEELPTKALNGAYMEVSEQRYGPREIRALYDSADFPLRRAAGIKGAKQS